ncbi:MAG: EsaB/YukD family protein [Clostridia bacterium]|nr:EsaB/YukD family protein [Clostridia bacterium]
MNRVIVTVEIPDSSTTYDMELPNDIPSGELAQMIAKSLHLEDNTSVRGTFFKIQADPPGRVLGEEETLAEAGVWDGSFITLL